MMGRLVCLLSLGLLISWSAEAKVFRNAYVAFELPDVWNCTLEHTEWVCRSNNEKESKEAIIILTAKEVGPTDTFEAYTSHLNAPQQVAYKGAGTGLSRIIYPPKKVQINDQPWIDGLHLASEVPNYYTRYLATIKDKIAILVTFSAHKDHYTKYSQDFFRAVMSLRVIATKNLLAKPEMGPLRPSGETLGGPIAGAMPGDMMGMEGEGGEGGGGGGSNTRNLMLGLALILAMVGGYIYWKSKRT
jgi:hypothetical protein